MGDDQEADGLCLSGSHPCDSLMEMTVRPSDMCEKRRRCLYLLIFQYNQKYSQQGVVVTKDGPTWEKRIVAKNIANGETRTRNIQIDFGKS